jgi:hypothetical protein
MKLIVFTEYLQLALFTQFYTLRDF